MRRARLKLFVLAKNTATLAKKYWTWSISRQNQTLVLQNAKNEGDVLEFPSVWLRDNCRCPSCYDAVLHSRLLSYKDFKASVLPKSVSCFNDAEDARIEIRWPDNHHSVYNLSWLREHSFDQNNQKLWLKTFYKFDKITWNVANFKNVLRRYSFDELLTSDLALLKWLITLNRRGVSIVEGAGTNELAIEKLTKRIGPIKETNYGKFYRVEAKEGATNAAYLSSALLLHIDLPYYKYAPSINFLHFTKQSAEGYEGTNQLVDGLEVCKRLKKFDPKMYEILANTQVDWSDVAKDEDREFHHIFRAPVICEDDDGDVIRLNFSQHQRDSHFCVSVKEANDWYNAMNWFVNIAHNSQNMVELKMKEGDVLTFDNLRVIHGRSAYTQKRVVIGVYMDEDIVNSKMRTLLAKQNVKNLDDLDE